MKQGRLDTITTRIISTTFMVVALAVFKPFGLDAWQWQGYAHLAVLWVIGFLICMMTDIILKYIIKMPRSFKKGVEYIIRRNLWFQLINTPLVALGICLYRHFFMSDRVESNLFSVVNFIETLAIIAFCSFAIGLSADKSNHSPLLGRGGGGEAVLSGTTNESVTLQVPDLLYIEAVGNYVKVSHLHEGRVRTDMLRATMKQMEETLRNYPMIVRCHRAFLVNLAQVEQFVSHSGSTKLLIKHCHESLPVSRSNMAQVKAAIKQR